MKEESVDNNNAKAFDFVIESRKREVKLGIERESDKRVRQEKEKGVKRNGGFIGAEEENETEENRNKS